MTRFITIQGNDETGYEADQHGIDQGPRLDTAIAWSATHIVLKTHGHSYNPGSPHSGLLSYFCPEIEVFEIVGKTPNGALEVKKAIGWSAGRGKNAPNPRRPSGPFS